MTREELACLRGFHLRNAVLVQTFCYTLKAQQIKKKNTSLNIFFTGSRDNICLYITLTLDCISSKDNLKLDDPVIEGAHSAVSTYILSEIK